MDEHKLNFFVKHRKFVYGALAFFFGLWFMNVVLLPGTYTTPAISTYTEKDWKEVYVFSDDMKQLHDKFDNHQKKQQLLLNAIDSRTLTKDYIDSINHLLPDSVCHCNPAMN
jgi:hypothetical protein